MSNRMKLRRAPLASTRTDPTDPYNLMAEATRPVFAEVVQALGESPTALGAELTVTDLLNAVAADGLDDAAATEGVLEALTAGLSMCAALCPAPMGLVLLRALAAVGPEAAREVVAEATSRIVAAGVVAPGWAEAIGGAKPLRASGYSDVWGNQESVTVVFEQGGSEHAVLVLLDHDLGGGIKDAACTEEVAALEAGLRIAAAQDADATFVEVPLTEARARLAAALARPECPVEPDQVEDVAMFRRLLVARLNAWAEADSEPRPKPLGVPNAATIKVGLRGASPPIWRRLEVPSDITLGDLHLAIQLAFGWEGSHLHDFSTRRRRWADPLDDLEETLDESAAPLLTAFEARTLTYTYDFGDSWEHRIDLEDVRPAVPGVAYPRCIGGRRAAPPDDIGGIARYSHLVAAASDRSDPDHAEAADELAEWGVDAPARFDAAAVTHALLGAPVHVRP